MIVMSFTIVEIYQGLRTYIIRTHFRFCASLCLLVGIIWHIGSINLFLFLFVNLTNSIIDIDTKLLIRNSQENKFMIGLEQHYP
jgi:hypothetical protein